MNPPKTSLSIDEALRFLLTDETAAQLTHRMARERLVTSIPCIDQLNINQRGSGLRPGMMVEVQGPCSSGKTLLLMQAAVNCLLNGIPRTIQAESIAMQQPGSMSMNIPCWVVFIDLDSKFDMVQFVTMLKRAVDSSLRYVMMSYGPSGMMQDQGSEWAQGAFEICLSRFHLIQPSSSFEVLAILLSAQEFFSKGDMAGTSKLLLIDNVSAFCSIDKATKDSQLISTPSSFSVQSLSASSDVGSRPVLSAPVLTIARVHAIMASLIKRSTMVTRCCILCSNHFTLPQASPSSSSVPMGGRDMMTTYWQEALTHRLLLSSPQYEGAAAGGGTRVNVVARVMNNGQEAQQSAPLSYGMVISGDGIAWA